MNLTSANEHVPKIERKIRVIKERVRAIIYSMPVNAVPSLVMTHMVMFVAKALNIFPVKGRIPGWSPKQIMTGKVVHYKYYFVITVFLMAPIAKYRKRIRHATVWWRGLKVPLLLGLAVMLRVVSSFIL